MSQRALNSEQFEHHQASPLDYTASSWVHPQRLSYMEPGMPEPGKHETYFAEQQRQTMRGKSGRRLKKPRTEITPGAAPGTAAFADYSISRYHRTPEGEPAKPAEIYVHYMKTRSDMTRRGYAQGLVEELMRRHPTASSVDFGKMMHEGVGAMKEKLEEKYPEHRFHGKVWYR